MSRLVFPDDPRPWTVLASEYIHRKPWLTVRQERVRTSTGAEIPEFWVSEHAPWINVIALTPERRLVLIRQYRHGLGRVDFELPAGTTDPEDPSLEKAARRELREETGYGGGRWSPFLSLCANPALQNNLTHTFVAEDVEPAGGPAPDACEDIRVHLVPLAEVEALIDRGGFVQALHVAALAHFLLKVRG